MWVGHQWLWGRKRSEVLTDYDGEDDRYNGR